MKYGPIEPVTVGPFTIEPKALGSRDLCITYYVENQKMVVEFADFWDLVRALQLAGYQF